MTEPSTSNQPQFEILFNIMQRMYTVDVLLLIIKMNRITRPELINFLKHTCNIPPSSAYRYLDTLVDNKMIFFSKTTQKIGFYSVPKNIKPF